MAAAALSSQARQVISVPLDLKYVNYDADAQALNVSTYAIADTNTDYTGVFGFGTAYYDKVKFVASSLINIVTSQPEKVVGTYKAQNSFGAAIRVTRMTRSTQALFERAAKYGEDLFFIGVVVLFVQIRALRTRNLLCDKHLEAGFARSSSFRCGSVRL